MKKSVCKHCYLTFVNDPRKLQFCRKWFPKDEQRWVKKHQVLCPVKFLDDTSDNFFFDTEESAPDICIFKLEHDILSQKEKQKKNRG